METHELLLSRLHCQWWALDEGVDKCHGQSEESDGRAGEMGHKSELELGLPDERHLLQNGFDW